MVELGGIPEVIVEVAHVLVILAPPSLDVPMSEALIDTILETVVRPAERLEVEVRVIGMDDALLALGRRDPAGCLAKPVDQPSDPTVLERHRLGRP